MPELESQGIEKESELERQKKEEELKKREMQ